MCVGADVPPRRETRRIVAVLMMVLLVPAVPVRAEVSAGDRERWRDMSLEDLLKVKLVTATKSELNLADTPGVVSVVSARQIRLRGYRSLADVLRSIPGFSVIDDHVISSASVRGVNDLRQWNSVLKVLIDGQPIS